MFSLNRKNSTSQKRALFSEKEKAAEKNRGIIKDELISLPIFQKLVLGGKLTKEEISLLKELKKKADKQISELD